MEKQDEKNQKHELYYYLLFVGKIDQLSAVSSQHLTEVKLQLFKTLQK